MIVPVAMHFSRSAVSYVASHLEAHGIISPSAKTMQRLEDDNWHVETTLGPGSRGVITSITTPEGNLVGGSEDPDRLRYRMALKAAALRQG